MIHLVQERVYSITVMVTKKENIKYIKQHAQNRSIDNVSKHFSLVKGTVALESVLGTLGMWWEHRSDRSFITLTVQSVHKYFVH